MYGTSKNFRPVAPSNPLFVDKPAIQIASNPLFWDKHSCIGQFLGPQIRYFWTRNGLSFPGPAISRQAHTKRNLVALNT